MTDLKTENQRLRDALHSIASAYDATAEDLRKKAEDTLKVVPFKMHDPAIHPDDALLVVVKIHKDRADDLSKTVKTMLNFFRIWKARELKQGNLKVAEAIQLTIDSYS